MSNKSNRGWWRVIAALSLFGLAAIIAGWRLAVLPRPGAPIACEALVSALPTIRSRCAEVVLPGTVAAAEHVGDGGVPPEIAHRAADGLPVGDLVADDYDVWSAPGILVVDGKGVVRYKRRSVGADVKPGKEIAEFWDGKVRAALDFSLQDSNAAP